jgi:hypothetical protein
MNTNINELLSLTGFELAKLGDQSAGQTEMRIFLHMCIRLMF